ncbi:MAG TPA: GSU2403 family nucleotidyltransferase fold protein [Elusimicrobiota bacterium]|nr:GSU2403 family nucleotidyltransferase fold protein [Elusimicrobiota bacterium]
MDDLFQRILKIFADLGLWEDGVELIGSWSFLLYQRHLGVRALPLRTQDVDFLIPWPYQNERMIGLSAALVDLGFRSVTAMNGGAVSRRETAAPLKLFRGECAPRFAVPSRQMTFTGFV